MSSVLTLCRVSPKRLLLLQDDPGLLDDVLAAGDDVPGLLPIGDAAAALCIVLEPYDPDGHLRALLNTENGVPLATGPAKVSAVQIYDVERVKAMSTLIESVPATPASERWPDLMGQEVEGDYFAAGSKNYETVDTHWANICELLDEVADRGHAVLSIRV